MTPTREEEPSWDRFQNRIKLAICRAAEDYETVNPLLRDLWRCETLLRSTDRLLDDSPSPAARELRSALVAHRAQGALQYDEVCAANVVLASMNAILSMLAEAER